MSETLGPGLQAPDRSVKFAQCIYRAAKDQLNSGPVEEPPKVFVLSYVSS